MLAKIQKIIPAVFIFCTFAPIIVNVIEKMDKDYIPHPIDTSDVELSEELLLLTEQLARNVHDIWSVGRLSEGWTYGPERSDTLKQNPCLVDYSDLPESEKAYDRNTAMETLKTILKLGWRVEKNDENI
jgi:ryanodine receptor 2